MFFLAFWKFGFDLGFDLGLDHGFDLGLDLGFDLGFDLEFNPGGGPNVGVVTGTSDLLRRCGAAAAALASTRRGDGAAVDFHSLQSCQSRKHGLLSIQISH